MAPVISASGALTATAPGDDDRDPSNNGSQRV